MGPAGVGCRNPGGGPAAARAGCGAGGDSAAAPVPHGPGPRDAGANSAARSWLRARRGGHREIGLKRGDTVPVGEGMRWRAAQTPDSKLLRLWPVASHHHSVGYFHCEEEHDHGEHW